MKKEPALASSEKIVGGDGDGEQGCSLAFTGDIEPSYNNTGYFFLTFIS